MKGKWNLEIVLGVLGIILGSGCLVWCLVRAEEGDWDDGAGDDTAICHTVSCGLSKKDRERLNRPCSTPTPCATVADLQALLRSTSYVRCRETPKHGLRCRRPGHRVLLTPVP